jgi:DNA-binding response OmpR family regulator
VSSLGYETITASDGSEAVDLFFEKGNIDLVILDVMLPDIDGYQVCSMIREHSEVPILMLTAKDQPDDEVSGFRHGTDDYIGKPFRQDILKARINALLRRKRNSENRLKYKDLVIDLEKHEARIDETTISFSPKEFDLLALFLRNKGKALSREKILESVWGYGFEGDNRVVDTNIKNLRAKLGEYKSDIETVRNFGYRFGAD